MEVRFVVEQAGCESCAMRVENALAPLADVHSVEIDEGADVATVRAAGGLTEAQANDALEQASHGSGHVYRVRAGSWREAK